MSALPSRGAKPSGDADDERCPRCGCVADYFIYRTPFATKRKDIVGCDECASYNDNDEPEFD